MNSNYLQHAFSKIIDTKHKARYEIVLVDDIHGKQYNQREKLQMFSEPKTHIEQLDQLNNKKNTPH